MQQRLGRCDQSGDPDKGGCKTGIVGSGSVQFGQVCAKQLDLESSASFDTGKDQVAASRHVPRHVNHARGIAESAGGPRLDPLFEMAAYHQRLQRGHAHSLAVNRIELYTASPTTRKPAGKRCSRS
jgi:hypothetical protein